VHGLCLTLPSRTAVANTDRTGVRIAPTDASANGRLCCSGSQSHAMNPATSAGVISLSLRRSLPSK
jgi:hypothetical protein